MEITPAIKDRLTQLFEENFREQGELGAALSIWWHGRPALELHGGFRDAHRREPWTPDTIVLVWSATKGPGAACLLHALQEHDISLQRRVAELWPEFAQAGKEAITLAQLLSHQAGLSAFDQAVEVQDYAAVVDALAGQAPVWPPGEGHGYHARTFGFLLDELIRRVTGLGAGEYWQQTFARPLALDFWIGLPAEMNARAATIYAARAGATVPSPPEFYRDLATPGTLVRRTFTSPRGLHAVSAMNQPQNRALPLVSFGGIGSATALGKFYAMLANGGELDGHRFFRRETIDLMSTTLSSGLDRVFGLSTAFSAGFMQNPDAQTTIFGSSPRAFGHPGAGGSHAFADPENNLAFAYVMNQMQQSLLPNEKSLRLVRALYGET